MKIKNIVWTIIFILIIISTYNFIIPDKEEVINNIVKIGDCKYYGYIYDGVIKYERKECTKDNITTG